MTPEARERQIVRRPLLAASALAWLVLAAQAGGIAMPAICSGMTLSWIPVPSMRSMAIVDLALALNPPARLATGWALMLAAMMLPLLPSPVRHVRERSLARRRGRAIAWFLAGYVSI